jgi:hypothetical protein
MTNNDKHIATYLVPIGAISILIGVALLVIASAVYVLGRNRLLMRSAERPASSN